MTNNEVQNPLNILFLIGLKATPNHVWFIKFQTPYSKDNIGISSVNKNNRNIIFDLNHDSLNSLTSKSIVYFNQKKNVHVFIVTVFFPL